MAVMSRTGLCGALPPRNRPLVVVNGVPRLVSKLGGRDPRPRFRDDIERDMGKDFDEWHGDPFVEVTTRTGEVIHITNPLVLWSLRESGRPLLQIMGEVSDDT